MDQHRVEERQLLGNTEDTAMLSELAHAVQLVAGCSPEVTPIMTSDEALKVLPA